MSATPPITYAPTIAAIRRAFEHRAAAGDALATELNLVLGLLPAETNVASAAPSAPHPIARHLAAALAPSEGRVDEILAPLRALSPALPWRYSYAARSDAPGLEHNVAWSEFVGPVAPIQSDRVCLGVTLIAPHTLYPAHRHPAIETYFVLSGSATWTAASRTQTQPPGAFILHPKNLDHSMQTWAEPLLAVYTWSGDVHSPSVYTDRSA
ncbi:MAG: dimethylsulfonioproprionate lyase family protein [Opitutaceae bacterium]